MHLKLPQLKAMCPPPFLHASLRLDQPIERPLWIGWCGLKLYSQPLGPPGDGNTACVKQACWSVFGAVEGSPGLCVPSPFIAFV